MCVGRGITKSYRNLQVSRRIPYFTPSDMASGDMQEFFFFFDMGDFKQTIHIT